MKKKQQITTIAIFTSVLVAGVLLYLLTTTPWSNSGEASAQEITSSEQARTDELIPEAVAVEKAYDTAVLYGFKGQPSPTGTLLTTLADSLAREEGFTLGRDAHEVGLFPEMPVWVVVFQGETFEHRGPGLPRPDGSPDLFDNIIVQVNARTGDLMGYSSYPDGDLPEGIIDVIEQ